MYCIESCIILCCAIAYSSVIWYDLYITSRRACGYFVAQECCKYCSYNWDCTES